MGPFSQVPGLAGYQQQSALNDQAGAQQMMKLSQLMQLANAQQGMQKGALEMSVMQDKLAREKKIRDALMAQQTGGAQPATAAPYGGGYSPAVASAFGVPAGQPTAAPVVPGGMGRALAQKLNSTADIYEQNGDFDSAMKIREHAQKLMPEIKEVRTQMRDGKPVEVIYYKDGSKEVSEFGAKPNIKLQSLGNKLVAIDENIAQNGQEWKMGQSPESVASNALGYARLNFDKTQAGKPQFHDGAWVTPPTAMKPGQSAPVPGIAPKLTEFQGKSAGYGARAAAAHEILNAIGEDGKVQPGLIKRVAESTPLVGEGMGTLTNWTQSAPQQQVEQAQRDFVNAVLRQESGAAISEGEFNNAKKQYFPQPGDTQEVVAQKARNREQAIAGFATGAGPQGAKSITSAKERMQAIFEANKAIKQGADKDAVKQRLESMGITNHGIR